MTMYQSEARSAITTAAVRHGVPPALALAVAQVESGINPAVRDGDAGEIGMFQLLPDTARFLAVSNPRDPYQNIDGGVRLLAWLLRRYGGDSRKALEAYNGGWGWVDKGRPTLAAQNYASKVLAVAGGAGLPSGALVARSPSKKSPGFTLPALPEVRREVWLGVGAGAIVWALVA